MSQPMQSTSLAATEVRARAADWLAQRVSEDWNENRQTALDAWLAESPAHRVAFLRVNGAWSHTYRLAALRAASPAQTEEGRGVRPIVARVAAALVLLAAVGAGSAFYFLGAQEKTYATQIGERQTIALGDGSQVELNTDTVLRVNAKDGARTVTLEHGEAFFQVKHDAAHPFEVMIGNHRVTDLGTKFLIRSEPNRLEVALVEGRARFESSDAQSTILTPGDVVVATANSMSVTKQSAHSVKSELGWQRGVLIFDSTPLADAAAELNRYNRQKLIVRDASAARLKIDGTFPIRNVSQFTEVAQAVFGLHVVKLGDETVISR